MKRRVSKRPGLAARVVPRIGSRVAAALGLLALVMTLPGGCSEEVSSPAPASVPVMHAYRFTDRSRVNIEPGGNVLVVNFWASWCPPCRREMPGLSRLAEDIPGLVVVGLSVDDDVYLAEEFLRTQELAFANYHDRDRAVANRLVRRHVYPQTFVFDSQGVLVHHVQGDRDWDRPDIRRPLVALATGRDG